jgi:DNA-binding CsgD family transcriptional regulator
MPKARVNASLMRAMYFKWEKNYEAMLAVAQTVLELSSCGLTHEDIYLRLMCVHAYCSLGRENEAKEYLLEIMRTNLPKGIISPFAESLHFMSGLPERLLEQEFPAYHKAVIGQYKRIYKNWLTFHNRFTKDNITLILTLREYQIAMLASQHVPRVNIAKQFNISPGRLNNIMAEIYSKLNISSRMELSKYVQ